jgi:hypothetical protein
MDIEYKELNPLQVSIYKYIDKERQNHAPDKIYDAVMKEFPDSVSTDITAAFMAYNGRNKKVTTA